MSDELIEQVDETPEAVEAERQSANERDGVIDATAREESGQVVEDEPAVVEDPPAGDLPAPIPDALEVPELAPQEHRFSDEVKENLAQLASVAQAEGIPLGETQGMVELYYELESTLGDLKVDQRDPLHQERTHAILRKQWGSQYQHHLDNARKAYKQLSPATQRFLDSTGASDDASCLTILAAMGGGILKTTPADAKAEADAMRKNNPALLSPGHPDHIAAKVRYRVLRHLEARGDREPSEVASEKQGQQALRDLKRPPKADPKRMALETEARTIRESPEYYKGGPSARALSARLRQIYAELYPE